MVAWPVVVMEAESLVVKEFPIVVEHSASFLGIPVEVGHCSRARIMEVGVHSKLQ